MPDTTKKSGWFRNRDVARHLNVTGVTIWRWQRDSAMGFPQPSVINGIPYTAVEEIDAWIRSHAVNRVKAKKTNAKVA
ncbi:putative DNA-binding transcriptional regulator AlpA [Bradyrhizobium sp. GM0.4]